MRKGMDQKKSFGFIVCGVGYLYMSLIFFGFGFSYRRSEIVLSGAVLLFSILFFALGLGVLRKSPLARAFSFFFNVIGMLGFPLLFLASFIDYQPAYYTRQAVVWMNLFRFHCLLFGIFSLATFIYLLRNKKLFTGQ